MSRGCCRPATRNCCPPPRDHIVDDHDGLSGTSFIRAVPSGTSVFSVHLADVALSIATGTIRDRALLVAADVGRAINPMIVEGQIVGGVVQGLGGTLLEQLVYGAEAQLQTGTFADYLLAIGSRRATDRALMCSNRRKQ